MKYLVICYDCDSAYYEAPETFGTEVELISAISEDSRDNDVADTSYAIYEVAREFKFVSPTVKGSLISVEK